MDQMKQKPRIAYVGIGLMGLPMTRRLLERGYVVTVCDLVPERTALARAAGASVADTPAEAVKDADLVLLNLPTTDAVERGRLRRPWRGFRDPAAATGGRLLYRQGGQGARIRRRRCAVEPVAAGSTRRSPVVPRPVPRAR